ncbi:hypothetical protein PMAYCL1PPCAC_31860 [Pristionchus mayeri]|uniref:Serpin domain-containing protein n=1 Tax=Pristionchus mayeri TaxID=1317129 RepID=A0AAN5IEY0_9BILA|nr:hypothetical protein PMAYCL1PPCAC_31860 [Pristionchus mayeri]
MAILINATHILAKWKHPFRPSKTIKGTFHAKPEKRMMFFMRQTDNFLVNEKNDIGIALIIPYQDETYNFFILMPNEPSNIETILNALTGESLVTVLNGAEELYCEIMVPKFKVESKLDGVDIYKKLEYLKCLVKKPSCPRFLLLLSTSLTLITVQ